MAAYRRVYDSRHLQAACCGGVRAAGRSYATTIIILNLHKILTLRTDTIIMPPPYGGHSGIAQSVRLTVPWRSCLGYTHGGCLQLSHRRPPEMCGLRTRPRTDVDPPRFLPPSNCEGISSRRAPGDTLFKTWIRNFIYIFIHQIMVAVAWNTASIIYGKTSKEKGKQNLTALPSRRL